VVAGARFGYDVLNFTVNPATGNVTAGVTHNILLSWLRQP